MNNLNMIRNKPGADLGDRLRRLGFRAPADALTAFLTHVHKSRVGPTETIEQLTDLEERARVAVNLERRTRAACLGVIKTFDRFDWQHPEKIDRPLVEKLANLEFVDRGENVLLKGASGLGKTFIAQHLAHTALAAGFTVRFATLATALADLLVQQSIPAFERRIRRYTRPDLLVLDELGYLPCDSRAADTLYNILSRRHEKRSTIITTNLGYKQWPTVFPGAACVGALVDRFSQHCHRVEIIGESWRDKHRLDPDRPLPIPKPGRPSKAAKTK
jgi:DNA replication protein DnaC